MFMAVNAKIVAKFDIDLMTHRRLVSYGCHYSRGFRNILVYVFVGLICPRFNPSGKPYPQIVFTTLWITFESGDSSL
jgi:hypothetical protein